MQRSNGNQTCLNNQVKRISVGSHGLIYTISHSKHYTGIRKKKKKVIIVNKIRPLVLHLYDFFLLRDSNLWQRKIAI